MFLLHLYPFVVYGSHVCALPIQKYRIPCNKRHTCVVSAHGHPRGKEIPPLLIKCPNLPFTSLEIVGTQEKCNDVDIINEYDLEDHDIIYLILYKHA